MKNWITTTVTDPWFPQVDLSDWSDALHYNTTIFVSIKPPSYFYADSIGVDLTNNSLYGIMGQTSEYALFSDIYDQAVNIKTTSVLLLAIGAVIIAFVISIDLKKYVYLSLILGIIVSAIAFWMFGLAFYHITKAGLSIPVF